VISDFITKLRRDPRRLTILGDGHQTKSYLYVEDCVNAILRSRETSRERIDVLNIGSEDQIEVTRVAQIVAEEMSLGNVKFSFTGGVNGGRGWVGDVKNMLLDISKLKSKGWRLTHSSEESVRLTARQILSK
jgi:UDP-glucose 4-epimerase